MATNLLLLFVGVLFALIVARLYKSAKVYIGILLMLLLGYVIGTGVKSVVANAQITSEKQFVLTESLPTNQCSFSTFVGIVNDTNIDLSQEKGDFGTVITNCKKGPMMPTVTEIENDS